MEPVTILLASTNKGKVREIRAALAGLSFVLRDLTDFPAFPVFPETGSTFEENARSKSLFYSGYNESVVLAEDSGLEIDKLGGAPGIYSARFSGPGATDERNIDKVLALLRDTPPPERGARFVCCLALSKAGRLIKEIRGTVEGVILSERRGHQGFGYDPIFYYPPLGKAFGELSAQEKNSVSHRGNALRQLREWLSSRDVGS